MKNNIYRILFLLIFTVTTVKDLIGQEQRKRLITDRPDITESAIAVPPGYLQIENGFLIENKKIKDSGLSGEIRNYTFSATLFRYGLLKNVELRVGGNCLFQKARLNNSESSETGISDFLVGTKFQLLEENLDDIDLGLIFQFHLPVGNEALRPESTESELLISFAKSLSGNLSFSGNIGTYRDSNPGKFIYLYSCSLGIDLKNDWVAFAEIYGDVSGRSKATFKYDFGFSYQPITNLQLDFSVGADPFTDFYDWFIGTGISIRLPH